MTAAEKTALTLLVADLFAAIGISETGEMYPDTDGLPLHGGPVIVNPIGTVVTKLTQLLKPGCQFRRFEVRVSSSRDRTLPGADEVAGSMMAGLVGVFGRPLSFVDGRARWPPSLESVVISGGPVPPPPVKFKYVVGVVSGSTAATARFINEMSESRTVPAARSDGFELGVLGLIYLLVLRGACRSPTHIMSMMGQVTPRTRELVREAFDSTSLHRDPSGQSNRFHAALLEREIVNISRFPGLDAGGDTTDSFVCPLGAYTMAIIYNLATREDLSLFIAVTLSIGALPAVVYLDASSESNKHRLRYGDITDTFASTHVAIAHTIAEMWDINPLSIKSNVMDAVVGPFQIAIKRVGSPIPDSLICGWAMSRNLGVVTRTFMYSRHPKLCCASEAENPTLVLHLFGIVKPYDNIWTSGYCVSARNMLNVSLRRGVQVLSARCHDRGAPQMDSQWRRGYETVPYNSAPYQWAQYWSGPTCMRARWRFPPTPLPAGYVRPAPEDQPYYVWMWMPTPAVAAAAAAEEEGGMYPVGPDYPMIQVIQDDILEVSYHDHPSQ